MTNILPPEELREVEYLYRSRMLMMIGSVLIASSLVAMVGLVPAAIGERVIAQTFVHTPSYTVASSTEESDELQTIGNLMPLLMETTASTTASDMIEQVLSYKPAGVSVSHIVLTGHTLILSGYASASGAGSYVQALRATTVFGRVSDPQESLVGSNELFTITVPISL